jgi:hypothetical protein
VIAGLLPAGSVSVPWWLVAIAAMAYLFAWVVLLWALGETSESLEAERDEIRARWADLDARTTGAPGRPDPPDPARFTERPQPLRLAPHPATKEQTP